MLHLVQKIYKDDVRDSHPMPQSYATLADGCALYRILNKVSPSVFVDLEIIRDPEEGGDASEEDVQTTMRGNLISLVRHLNEYCRNTLQAKLSDFNLTAVVNVSRIVPVMAKRRGGESRGGESRGGDSDASGEENQGQFATITDLFVAAVALSGVPTLIDALKQLPREEQQVLSNITREMMKKYGLTSSRASADPRRSARPSRFGSPAQNSSGSSPMSNTLIDDSSYYRAKNMQLTQELEECKSSAALLESKMSLVVEEKRNIESKYKQLLEEMERRPSQDTESLQILLQQKTDENKALTVRVEEQESRIKSLKHAMSAQEEVAKQKMKQLEGTMVRIVEDRREVENKLSLAEDKLTGHAKIREELQNEIEDLRSKYRLLQLSSKPNDGDDENNIANTSFASTGSVGRAMALEREVTEARRQRDNLQKQVYVLQRQFAAAAAPSAVSQGAAAQDTLKAQVRQLERERDSTKRQLQEAQEHILELERQVAASAEGKTTAEEAEATHGDVGTDSSKGTPQKAGSAAASVAEKTAVDGEKTSGGAEEQGSNALATSNTAHKQQQALLSSLLVSFAYHNTLLQQHDFLLFLDKEEGYAERRRQERHKQEFEHCHRGTLLSRQRRMVEEGLLESVVHNQITGKAGAGKQ